MPVDWWRAIRTSFIASWCLTKIERAKCDRSSRPFVHSYRSSACSSSQRFGYYFHTTTSVRRHHVCYFYYLEQYSQTFLWVKTWFINLCLPTHLQFESIMSILFLFYSAVWSSRRCQTPERMLGIICCGQYCWQRSRPCCHGIWLAFHHWVRMPNVLLFTHLPAFRQSHMFIMVKEWWVSAHFLNSKTESNGFFLSNVSSGARDVWTFQNSVLQSKTKLHVYAWRKNRLIAWNGIYTFRFDCIELRESGLCTLVNWCDIDCFVFWI